MSHKLCPKNLFCNKQVVISILSLQPKISVAEETTSPNLFSKLFSKKSVEANQSDKNQIYKLDIDSLNIDTLIDIEFYIRDIMKNYMDEKNVNKLINKITEKEEKNKCKYCRRIQ